MRRVLLAILLAAATAPAARGQGPLPAPAATPTPRPGDDPLARLFFPPELVIGHAQEIGLQAAQRTTIVNALKEAQSDLIDLQMSMAERGQELARLIGGPRVDEAAALAQVDKLLAMERGMKVRQLQLLIRIKNTLTPEQQQQLAALRDRGEKRE
jgi:Spy/CpxP family protein refolding chaperone